MQTPTLAHLLKTAIEHRLLDVHTAMIAKVERYDADKQLVDVAPVLKRRIPNAHGDWVNEELPLLCAEVTRLLSSQNILASVQNQGLQLRKKNQPLQKEAIVLSSETGLLASPEMGSKGTVIVRSLLMAELAPGRKVRIDSAVFKGFVTIQTVRFTGSNFSHEWEVEMEGAAQ